MGVNLNCHLRNSTDFAGPTQKKTMLDPNHLIFARSDSKIDGYVRSFCVL
jgi:hypothetical protein